MTTAARYEVPTAREHAQSHDPAAICWLCSSDGPAWWARVRERRGLSEPPYADAISRIAMRAYRWL